MGVSAEVKLRDRLVGTWNLVTTEETWKEGHTAPFPPFGIHGRGILMYQADGYMCAILQNPDRPSATFAYCGRYEIDTERKEIVHFPEVATDPAWVGSRQVCPYEFEDERLIFSGVENVVPDIACWKIVWEKR